jgi:hypothetical protein
MVNVTTRFTEQVVSLAEVIVTIPTNLPPRTAAAGSPTTPPFRSTVSGFSSKSPT